MDIIVEGSHITIKIDGVVTAEATLDDMGKTGSFDIATFHDGSFLSIRKIEMKELTSTTSPALTELRRVVVVSEGLLRQTRERYAAGAIPVSDVTAAEIDLLEARIPLAEAEQKPGDVWHLLRELVVKREAELEFARKLVEAGRMPTSTVNVADKRVALARARVAQFETKLPDAIRLEGRWTPISAEHAGQPVPVEQIKERICGGLIIRDGRWGSVIGGKQNEGGLHVDAAKLPKQIEFSGSIFEYRIVGRGIYQLDGDNLILCLAEKGQERPNTFTTSPANNFVLIRYRRESPTAKESP
jgi:uncharacterized protein (TIGR03067 family)